MLVSGFPTHVLRSSPRALSEFPATHHAVGCLQCFAACHALLACELSSDSGGFLRILALTPPTLVLLAR